MHSDHSLPADLRRTVSNYGDFRIPNSPVRRLRDRSPVLVCARRCFSGRLAKELAMSSFRFLRLPLGIALQALGLNAQTQLTIFTSSVTRGTVGTFYSEPFQAIGGPPPYSWFANGVLPTGLTDRKSTRLNSSHEWIPRMP